jgi:hypothetical protein
VNPALAAGNPSKLACGWDFSFYHILVKLQTSYYIEVMSDALD